MRPRERTFVIVLLLVSMHVVSGLLSSSRVNTETSSAIISTDVHLPTVIAELGLYLWCAVLIIPGWKVTFSAARLAWPILLLPALSVLSCLWSIDPFLTLRRSSFLSLSTIMAIYLGERYSIEEFANLFAQAECWLMVGSVAMFFVLPAKVLDPSHIGAWKGLTVHKNVFGECMAVSVLLLLLVRFRKRRILQVCLWCAALLLLYLAHSITPTLACGVVFLAVPVLRHVSRLRIQERVISYAFLAGIVSIGAFVVTNYSGDLLELVGRDSTLSGRAQLWSLVMDAIWKRPVLGYGYEAFWQGFKGDSRGILESTGWLVPMAHNGYLDLWLSLGLVGVAVYVFVFMKSMRMALSYLRRNRKPIGAWPVAYLSFFALHNSAESTLLTRTTFEFLVFVAISVSLQQSELRERSTQREPEEEGVLGRPFHLPSPALDEGGLTT
jgi:exopolysaccharide production protein ExoQ